MWSGLHTDRGCRNHLNHSAVLIAKRIDRLPG
jgi:hypothetical protein